MNLVGSLSSPLLLLRPPTDSLLRHGSSPSSLGMFLYRFVTLAIAASTLLGLSVTAGFYKPCENPSVRREWRSMPPEERAEWLAAVKVERPLGTLLRKLMTSMCSVSKACLTALRCPRPSILRTPRSRPSTRTVRTSMVCSHHWLSTVAEPAYSHRIRLGLRPYGPKSYCGSLFPSPTRQWLNPSIDPLHRPVPAMASRIYQGLRHCPPSKVQLHRQSAVLGLDKGYCTWALFSMRFTNMLYTRRIGF